MSKQAMELALEALEDAQLDASMAKSDVSKHIKAIQALKQALAGQPLTKHDYKLVPVEPTWDMKMAASSNYREPQDGHYTARMKQAADCYAAMLKAAPQLERKRLTNEEFLELILRKGTQELVGLTTYVGDSIQMQGRIGLLHSAKLIKEFLDNHYDIT